LPFCLFPRPLTSFGRSTLSPVVIRRFVTLSHHVNAPRCFNPAKFFIVRPHPLPLRPTRDSYLSFGLHSDQMDCPILLAHFLLSFAAIQPRCFLGSNRRGLITRLVSENGRFCASLLNCVPQSSRSGFHSARNPVDRSPDAVDDVNKKCPCGDSRWSAGIFSGQRKERDQIRM